MEHKVIAYILTTPDGTILQSYSTHDYKTYIDTKDGEEYMIDGGNSYLRCSRNALDKIRMVTTDDEHEVKREWFHWGTYGKDGKQPLKWKALKDLDTDHIEAILKTQHHISDQLRELFKDELEYRKQVS